MVSHRLLLASAFVSVVSMITGCAPPEPGEETGDSNDALSGGERREQPTSSDTSFALRIRGREYLPYFLMFAKAPDYRVPEGKTTTITSSLHLTIEVDRENVGKVKGCAGAFSTIDLSPAQIAAKDAELLRACATPTTVLDGREDWVTVDGAPSAARAELRNDVTPFLTTKQHLVYVFELNGRSRSYVFESWR